MPFRKGGRPVFSGDQRVIDNDIDSSQSNELIQGTRLQSRIVLWSFVATIGISLISILGWVSNLLIVAQISPNFIPMAPSTALIFILFSASSYVHYRQPRTLRQKMLMQISGFSTFIICSAILARFLTGATLDIEQFLLKSSAFVGTIPIGRMSPITAVSFLLASTSLLLLVSFPPAERRRASSLAVVLAVVVASIGFVTVIGYLYNAPLLYGSSTIPIALTTAIAFVSLGTGLCASAGPAEGGQITLSTNVMDGLINVQVADNGIGIKHEDFDRLFQPFSSIQKPSYVKGTGLGLSISKGLVEAHGGKIWAESKGEGQGATFIFTLPKRKEAS